MISKITALLVLTITCVSAQVSFQILEETEIPESFIKTYAQKIHDYNPLHVGDIWQYNFDNSLRIIEIEKDTIVNEKRYFFRKHYNFYFNSWERNDTLNSSILGLDVNDLNNNGKTDDELLLDSLEVPNYTGYYSFRYLSKDNIPPDSITAFVEDSSWTIIFGDTVMSRRIQYLAIFTTIIVADKYGVIWSMTEGPPRILTGAIINGKKYGTIVSVDSVEQNPIMFSLSQNYPNPFNPSTTIEYNLNESGYAKIVVYDILGRQVETLLSGYKNAGNYRIEFNANELASGVYFYSIIFNNQIITKQMLLLK